MCIKTEHNILYYYTYSSQFLKNISLLSSARSDFPLKVFDQVPELSNFFFFTLC